MTCTRDEVAAKLAQAPYAGLPKLGDISALIEALLAAPEPSRELDAKIAIAAKLAPIDAFRPCGSSDPGEFGTGAYTFWKALEYTSSLDAALTLVPGGLCWRYDSALGHAVLFDLSRSPVEVAESGDAELTTYPPALALVIASLRARQAGEGREAARFQQLVLQWHKERGATSSITEMAMCRSYLRIIAMGEQKATPLIFRQMENEGEEPDMWFVALQVLTGADPVTEDARGDFKAMADLWLTWGHDNGYAW